MIESIGPNLCWLLRRITKAGQHQCHVSKSRYYGKVTKSRHGIWVGRLWLMKEFPSQYAAAILDGTDEIEITQQQALEAVNRLRR